VFAGAAREAVFSNPDVIKRVNADFILVALKAGLVNRPPDDEEGLLYREIERSKPAPQGLCVVNSAGKVLNWTLMFDDDRSVLAFLDHVKERFTRHPDARQPVTAEVHQMFPSQKRADVEDSGTVLPVLDRHPEGKYCPAAPPLRQGTVAVRLFGRALDKDGKPVADTVRQEHYIEDRFNIAVQTQDQLARALVAGKGPVMLPLDLTRQWVKHAHLGMLDVQPLDNPGRGKGELRTCSFVATPARTGKRPTLWRVEGESEAFIDDTMANGSPGDLHEVKLKWQGFIEMDEKRMTWLVLSASGKEKLKFGSGRGNGVNEVASLPGGHRIDMACEARYGFLGEPAGPDQVAVDVPDAPPPGVPDAERRQITATLGPPFLVYRVKVQTELRLSEEQKKKLEKRLEGTVHDAMQFFQRLQDAKTEERPNQHRAYVEKAQEKLTAFLEGALKEEQLKRLRQVMLQREGLFALGNAEIMRDLEITDHQRQQFGEIVQEFQKKIEPLLKEAERAGNPEEIRPKLMKIREEQVGRIEALLSDAQKTQWKKMLGKPFDLGDTNDK
jgi:hypothetical protein